MRRLMTALMAGVLAAAGPVLAQSETPEPAKLGVSLDWLFALLGAPDIRAEYYGGVLGLPPGTAPYAGLAVAEESFGASIGVNRSNVIRTQFGVANYFMEPNAHRGVYARVGGGTLHVTVKSDGETDRAWGGFGDVAVGHKWVWMAGAWGSSRDAEVATKWLRSSVYTKVEGGFALTWTGDASAGGNSYDGRAGRFAPTFGLRLGYQF